MIRTAGRFQIFRAGKEHVDMIVPLFDAYRQFYGQPSDRGRARTYLSERLGKGESVVFLALQKGERDTSALGFTQLYPSFSSISMSRLWILYDLYVAAQARKQGVGKALMEQARRMAVETGAHGLVLETAIDNHIAQRLYEQLGYQRDVAFYRYSLQV